MKKNIEIKICYGTLCFVMGGSTLELLLDQLPPELIDEVDIIGSSCLGYCDKKGKGKPPFVEINGKCLDQATPEKIAINIKEILNGIHQ